MPCLVRGVGAKVYSVALKVHFCAGRAIKVVRKWVKQVRMRTPARRVVNVYVTIQTLQCKTEQKNEFTMALSL